jgi:hypothetical protein
MGSLDRTPGAVFIILTFKRVQAPSSAGRELENDPPGPFRSGHPCQELGLIKFGTAQGFDFFESFIAFQAKQFQWDSTLKIPPAKVESL